MAQLDRVTLTVELTIETNMHDTYAYTIAKAIATGEYSLGVLDRVGHALNTVRVVRTTVERSYVDTCDACTQAELLRVLTFALGKDSSDDVSVG